MLEGMSQLFHIVSESDWASACEVGRYAPESLATEGFIHFSLAHQVAGTANARFRDLDDLIVVEVDPSLLDEPVVFEDLYGMGQDFPHVYAAIPTRAAVACHELARDAHGHFVFAG
jgi:uncharacterized protein (DUF952 family)